MSDTRIRSGTDSCPVSRLQFEDNNSHDSADNLHCHQRSSNSGSMLACLLYLTAANGCTEPAGLVLQRGADANLQGLGYGTAARTARMASVQDQAHAGKSTHDTKGGT